MRNICAKFHSITHIWRFWPFFVLRSPTINNGKKLDISSKKIYFVGYDKCSPSYIVYYHEKNKVMKHRIVHFTEKFENNMANDVINEDIINFDSLDENGGFTKEEENVIDNSDNIIENKSNKNSKSIYSESGSGVSGHNSCRSRNDKRRQYPKRATKAPAYLNKFDVNTAEDVVIFLNYCYLLSILENYEYAIRSDDSQ